MRFLPKFSAFHLTVALWKSPGVSPCYRIASLSPFCNGFFPSAYQLLMETSGERPLELVCREVHKIVDVKCPGSGEHLRIGTENLGTLTARDELKFVLASRADYEYARNFIHEHGLESKPAGLILSPGLSQRSHRLAFDGELSARSARPRRMDARRQSQRPPRPPDPQIHLGAATQRRIAPRRSVPRQFPQWDSGSAPPAPSTRYFTPSTFYPPVVWTPPLKTTMSKSLA